MSPPAPAPERDGPAPAAKVRLFVVHAPEDAWFVEGFLLEALRLPEGEVLISSKLEPGVVIVNEIARGALSPVTVVVVSPAFLASPWAQFAHQLAMHQSIEAAADGSATLVPAILADCALPMLSRFRVPLDFRDQDRAHWEAEADKLRKKLAAPTPVVVPVPCPYPGIRAFTTEDAARFHGRDNEVRELLGRLRDGQRELYAVGPSGSGKSSLVAAGLVPSVCRSPELAGGSFLVRQMWPGDDPAATLAGVLGATAANHSDGDMAWMSDAISRLLANSPEHDRLLIVIDQLEELFTIAEATARVAFAAGVRALRGDARVALVLTLRADFYAQLMESSLWAGLDGQRLQFNVGPLRGDKLREAIEAPARALGVYFELVLVKQLLHDAADEPGALPLLQDSLLDLWHRRTCGLLRLKEYEAMSDSGQSGLAVTVARKADSALNELSSGRQEIARRVLLRLVQFGDGTTTTRRQQLRATLATAGDAPDDIDAVIHHLADRRLVTTSGGDEGDPSARIDLAHEVLLSAWPALREWIRSRRKDEQHRRVLEAKAAEWVNSGRGQSRLLDADELREVHGWLSDDKARDLGVSQAIKALLAHSESALAAQVAEAEARIAEVEVRRRQVRRFAGAIGVGLILLLAVIAATAIWVARTQEQELQRDVLSTNAYAAHALAGGVAFRLREEVDATVAIAADPAVVQALHTGGAAALEQWRKITRFDTVALYDRSGIVRVLASPVAERSRNLGKDYSWRDYIRGARQLGEAGLRSGYISRALLSETDNIWMFGIAAPVYNEGTWAGVLLITIGTDAALGQQRLDRASDDGPMAVIVAPRDRSRATTEGEGDYVVILHDGLTHGAGIAMDSPRLRELRATRKERNQLRWIDPDPITDDAYRDPVPGFEGRWLAGFAPVGDTGFVVIVQTRYDAALKPNTRLSRRLARGGSAVIFVWLVACGTFLWGFVHRRGLS